MEYGAAFSGGVARSRRGPCSTPGYEVEAFQAGGGEEAPMTHALGGLVRLTVGRMPTNTPPPASTLISEPNDRVPVTHTRMALSSFGGLGLRSNYQLPVTNYIRVHLC